MKTSRLQRATNTVAWLTVQPSTVNGTELGGTGISRRPLPVVWPQTPGPTNTLWWLPGQVLHQSHPWLQKGQPRYGVSQRSPWRGSRPVRQSLQPLPRARRPPHLLRSWCEEDEGCASRGRRKLKQCSSAAARGHGIEGRPADPWPLEAGDRQCLRHACREHRHPDAQDEGSSEVPNQGGLGKKRMNLEAFLQQRRHFSPFVALEDGMLEVEATTTLKRLAIHLAKKWKILL